MSDEIKVEIAALVPRLRRFAYALCGSREEGDDLVQTACVKALSRLEQYEPYTRLDSWMYRIVQNTYIDVVRHRSRFRTSSDPETLDRLSEGGRSAAASEHRLLLEKVRSEIDKLPEAQRLVIALVAIEGYSYKEAAETLDLPIGTIMSRLARARERLLPLIAEGVS